MRYIFIFANLAIIGSFVAEASPPGKARIQVAFDRKLGPMEIDRVSLGQGGLSDQPMWEGRINEIKALHPRLIRLFVQEYFHLQPAREFFHFQSLDRSVSTILESGAKPLMCLCFKPPILFPKVDQDIVEPRDYSQWEHLVSMVVSHYMDLGAGIRYWEVANEPDIGESGGCPYRFQPESYVRYYQHTARAILRVDPQALVGGPALANVYSPILPALLKACESSQIPLHFISWHIYSSDPWKIRSTVDHVNTLLATHPTLKAETLLDEWNMDLQDPSDDPRFQPCFILESIWQMKDAGLTGSCYYQIRDVHVDHDQFTPFMSAEGAAFMTRWWNRMPQFDGLFDFQNRVRPSYFAFKLLSRLTGTQIMLHSDSPAVHGFATHDEKFHIDQFMLWNFGTKPVTLSLELKGLPSAKSVRRLALNSLAASDDENMRIHYEQRMRMTAGDHTVQLELLPYDVRFWSFE